MNSIGDFAEKLILSQVEDIKEGKALPQKLEEARSSSSNTCKDISNIEVPTAMMRDILGESFYPQETPPAEDFPELVWDKPEEEVPATKPGQLTEETGLELLSLLGEVRSMILNLKEMTGAGGLGSNFGGPCEDPMKGKDTKTYRKPTRSAILKNSIRRKIK